MRKKSHILLARFIADQMDTAQELQSHRKAFCLGSVLPDMKPSFLTKKHEFGGTFSEIQDKMKELTVECELESRNERVYWRQLGEVIHYVADYFTFPHNVTYEGTLLEHGQYEKTLKNRLKSYILSGQADIHVRQDLVFENFHELSHFIKKSHELYLSKERNVAEDMEFILTICYQVVQGMFRLLKEKGVRPAVTAVCTV